MDNDSEGRAQVKVSADHIRAVLKRVGEPVKERTTLYISAAVMKRFKKLCKKRKLSVSEVVDAAMQDILKEYE